MSQAHLHLSPDAIYPFDARGVAKRFRHAAIFGALDSLQAGETMRFANDHDPLPLLSQNADLARLILSVGAQPFIKWMGR